MTALNKLKSAAAKAVDNFDPNMLVETRDVLALLASLEAEPVAWTTGRYSQNIGYKFGEKEPYEAPCIMSIYWDFDTFRTHTDCDATALRWLEEAIKNTGAKPLYTAPQAPVSMKDHQIRELVNELRDIAVEYHGTQQLRERIARTVRAAMLQAGNSPAAQDGWIPVSEQMPEAHEPVYIFHPDYGVDQCVWYDDQEEAFLWDSDNSRCRAIETVSHWMPMPVLPASPKKEYL